VARADYVDDVGYAPLLAELGALPDGTGLEVTLVEACKDPAPGPCDLWRPDPGNRSVTIGDGGAAVYAPYSGHATSSGNRFYGNISTAPGIGIPPGPSISAYKVDDWLGSAFLRFGVGRDDPYSTSSRVASHSWVGGTNTDGIALELMRRLDWLIDTDEYLQIVGFTGPANPLLASAFNIIAVNKTGSPTNGGAYAIAGDAAYDTSHPRPHLVVSETWPSTATPRVASASAMLVSLAHMNPSLSNGSTVNRNGDTIRNAERSEVIKAALMAGADRATSNSYPSPDPANISNYRVNPADRTANGLDRRFGAGQLSIYNSYYILLAGEQDSLEDNGVGTVTDFGFDYDPAFGGSNGSNDAGTYFFSTGAEVAEFFATLAWNIEIDPGRNPKFQRDAILQNLDLQLYDVSDMGNWELVQESASDIDNTENIRAMLAANTDYALRVAVAAGQTSFDWDYAVAWRNHVPGDIDGDRDVDVADVVLIQRAVAGHILLTQPQHSRADLYPTGGDGALTVSDWLAAQKIRVSH